MLPLKVQTEKGDKPLVLLFASAARRWCKYVLLGGLFFVAGWSAARSIASLRSSSFNETTNVALRPVDTRPHPDIWHSMTRRKMQRMLDCEDYYNTEMPIHDAKTWIGMREAYISVVGTEMATVELDGDRTFETAFRVQFEARQSPGKGRGIFALQDVPKGEVLYDFSQSAQFTTGRDFAEFLRILRPDLACDVLMWSYVQYFGPGSFDAESKEEFERMHSHLRIVTDLDPGSFCNGGKWSAGNMAWINSDGEVASGDEENPPVPIVRKDGSRREDAFKSAFRKDGRVREEGVKSAPLVAVRSIKEGEELLCIYDQFSEGLSLMIT